jgi:hypothetical protein
MADADRVRRLAAEVSRDRRETLLASACIVLLTTGALAVVSWLLGGMAFGWEGEKPDPRRARIFLTGLNAFLAWMFLAIVPGASRRGHWPWIAAGGVSYGLQLLLTYSTWIPIADPSRFGLVYGLLSFATLGLLGHAYVPGDDTFLPGPFAPTRDPEDPEIPDGCAGFVVAAPRFIVGGFADSVGSVWIWRPLSDAELGVSADVLDRLSVHDRPGAEEALRRVRRGDAVHLLRWLDRLDLVRRKPDGLLLTTAGEQFLGTWLKGMR